MYEEDFKTRFFIFIKKMPSVLSESIKFLLISFIGVILNIFFAYGILKYTNKAYTPFELIQTNDFLFGLFSTIAGIYISIHIFYLKTKREERSYLFIFMIIAFLLSVVLSTIALFQSQNGEFFDKTTMNIGTIFILITLVIATIFFKYDEKEALLEHKREESAQKKADNSREINNATIGDLDIKV